jgi:hypothetical protein
VALAPRTTFEDPQTWLFFAGYEFGHPIWITRQKWESRHNAAGEWLPPTGQEFSRRSRRTNAASASIR